MSTGDQFVALSPKRLLGVQDFGTRLIEYVRGLVTDIHDVAFGLDGVFGGVPITMSAGGHGNDRFQLDNDATCSDGAGHFLETDAALAYRDIGLFFENTSAIVYSIGLHFDTRPRGVQVNPRTTDPEFVGNEEHIGNRAEPTSVVDNGDGTMTFNVNSVADPFGTTVRTHAGRRCLVWKKIPGENATTEPAAVEEILVVFGGGNNTITTTLVGVGGAGTFGQASPSTLASDYFVMMLGPTVTRKTETDLDLEVGYVFIGEITGNGPAAVPASFDVSGQNDLSSGFAVDINDITRGPVNGRLKVSTTAHPLDSEENQIDARDSGGTVRFSVDEDGDTVVNDLNVVGTATINEIQNLTVLDNALIGTAEADAHTMRGSWVQRDDLNAIVSQFLATGELGALGAAASGFALTAHDKTDLKNRNVIGADLNAGVQADALVERLDFGSLNTNADRNLIGKWSADGVTFVRLYARQAFHGFIVTINAAWDDVNTQWQSDLGANAYALFFNDGAFAADDPFAFRLKTVAGTWTDSQWDGTDNNAALTHSNAGAIEAGLVIEGFRQIVAGSGLLLTRPNAAIGRFRAAGPATDISSGTLPTYTNILEFLSGVGAFEGWRIYAKQNLGPSSTPLAGLWFAQNAVWQGSSEDWVQEDVDQPSIAIHVSTFNFNPSVEERFIRFLHRDPEGAFTTWTDGNWNESVRWVFRNTTAGDSAELIVNDQFAGIEWQGFSPTTGGKQSPNPDVGTAALANTLRAKNLIKAWAVVTITAGVGVVTDGFGVTSTLTDLSAQDLGINLASGNTVNNLLNAAPFVSVLSGGPVIMQAGMPFVNSQIRVEAWDTSGTPIRLDSGGATTIKFMVGLLALQT